MSNPGFGPGGSTSPRAGVHSFFCHPDSCIGRPQTRELVFSTFCPIPGVVPVDPQARGLEFIPVCSIRILLWSTSDSRIGVHCFLFDPVSGPGRPPSLRAGVRYMLSPTRVLPWSTSGTRTGVHCTVSHRASDSSRPPSPRAGCHSTSSSPRIGVRRSLFHLRSGPGRPPSPRAGVDSIMSHSEFCLGRLQARGLEFLARCLIPILVPVDPQA